MKDIAVYGATVIRAIQEDRIFREIDGEAVILNIKTGAYCGLNSVGTRIWQMIQQPISVQDICNRLLAEYNVDRQRCERDLLNLLRQMAAMKIIEVTSAESA